MVLSAADSALCVYSLVVNARPASTCPQISVAAVAPIDHRRPIAEDQMKAVLIGK